MSSEYGEEELEEMVYDAVWSFVSDDYRDDAIELEQVELEESKGSEYTFTMFGSPLGDFPTEKKYETVVNGEKVWFTVDGGVGLGQFQIRMQIR